MTPTPEERKEAAEKIVLRRFPDTPDYATSYWGKREVELLLEGRDERIDLMCELTAAEELLARAKSRLGIVTDDLELIREIAAFLSRSKGESR